MQRLFLTISIAIPGVGESIRQRLLKSFPDPEKKLTTAFISTPVEGDADQSDLSWVEEERVGLKNNGSIWEEMTVIPHFNNREGGADLDTSYCYIGTKRATKLLSMLPESTPIIGLDEHTCLIVDLATGSQIVRGKGQIHKIR